MPIINTNNSDFHENSGLNGLCLPPSKKFQSYLELLKSDFLADEEDPRDLVDLFLSSNKRQKVSSLSKREFILEATETYPSIARNYLSQNESKINWEIVTDKQLPNTFRQYIFFTEIANKPFTPYAPVFLSHSDSEDEFKVINYPIKIPFDPKFSQLAYEAIINLVDWFEKNLPHHNENANEEFKSIKYYNKCIFALVQYVATSKKQRLPNGSLNELLGELVLEKDRPHIGKLAIDFKTCAFIQRNTQILSPETERKILGSINIGNGFFVKEENNDIENSTLKTEHSFFYRRETSLISRFEESLRFIKKKLRRLSDRIEDFFIDFRYKR
jgi:hypothetical protein